MSEKNPPCQKWYGSTWCLVADREAKIERVMVVKEFCVTQEDVNAAQIPVFPASADSGHSHSPKHQLFAVQTLNQPQ